MITKNNRRSHQKRYSITSIILRNWGLENGVRQIIKITNKEKEFLEQNTRMREIKKHTCMANRE